MKPSKTTPTKSLRPVPARVSLASPPSSGLEHRLLAEARRKGALALAEREERIVLLHGIDGDGRCTCRGKTKGCRPGKHPRFRNYAERATDDPKEIRAFFDTYPVSNVGRLVHDDEIVVDVDKPTIFAEVEQKVGTLPKAPTVLTGSGGERRHIFLKRPTGEIETEHEWGQVKVSGYVVAPPSATAEPYRYATGLSFDEIERPECPPEWCDILLKKPTTSAGVQGGATRQWTSALGEDLLERALEEAVSGQRHPACTKMVLQLRDNRAPYIEAKKIVEDFAVAVKLDGDHPFTQEEASQILESIYRTPPRDSWASSKANPSLPQEPDPDIKSVSLWELVNEDPEEEQSLLGDGILVRNSINVLAGEGGVGKTCLACQMGLSLASKTSFLNMDVKSEVPVLYLLAEGNRYKFADRLKKAAECLGITLKDLPIFCLDRKQPIPQIGSAPFARLIEERQAQVVFLDTHGFFHAGEDNSRTDWKEKVVKPLRSLHLSSEPAFVLLDHLSKENLKIKKKSSRLGPRIVGAGNKRDDSDSVFILDWPNGELDPLRTLYFEKLKNREPKAPVDLDFDLPTGTFAIKPLTIAKVISRDQGRLRDLKAYVTQDMETAEIVKGLQRRLNLGKSAIEKLLKRACDEKAIRWVKQGVYGPVTDEDE